ncbi:hypothetical protein ABVT39_024565 [Epinephelus coioides]
MAEMKKKDTQEKGEKEKEEKKKKNGFWSWMHNNRKCDSDREVKEAASCSAQVEPHQSRSVQCQGQLPYFSAGTLAAAKRVNAKACPLFLSLSVSPSCPHLDYILSLSLSRCPSLSHPPSSTPPPAKLAFGNAAFTPPRSLTLSRCYCHFANATWSCSTINHPY